MSMVRVATYNIHKGVQGIGPARRLEIHNLGHAVEQLYADIVCLQEVRKVHRREAEYFPHWPEQPQADFLAPEGYTAIYQTNAHTRHGEHGNAMLSRWPVVSHNCRVIASTWAIAGVATNAPGSGRSAGATARAEISPRESRASFTPVASASSPVSNQLTQASVRNSRCAELRA